jgi:hypothetical protein
VELEPSLFNIQATANWFDFCSSIHPTGFRIPAAAALKFVLLHLFVQFCTVVGPQPRSAWSNLVARVQQLLSVASGPDQIQLAQFFFPSVS